MRQTIIIGGVGTQSGLSEALIDQALEHGYAVLATARSKEGKEALVGKYRSNDDVAFSWLDLKDQAALGDAVSCAEQNLGPIAAYIHNAAKLILKPFTDTTLDDYRACWQTSVETAITASHTIMPRLEKAGNGTMIFLGATASQKGNAGSAPFAASKFALRGFAQSLAREFGPKGIHVAHLTIDGVIKGNRAQSQFGLTEETCIDPAALAKTILSVIQQEPSCWTHELDIRPHTEKF